MGGVFVTLTFSDSAVERARAILAETTGRDVEWRTEDRPSIVRADDIIETQIRGSLLGEKESPFERGVERPYAI
jgi:hypothetical protein